MPSDICQPDVADVRIIITTALEDAAVAALIDDATLLVEDCVSALSCSRQATIIKWVTAHLIASMSTSTAGQTGVLTSESLGDASRSYAKPTLGEQGLHGTTYGQQAIAYDPNGCLATLGARKTLFKVL